ncbi:MAG: 2-amino-4-hydroxy-6-hydroxymethyldihydropteridine diphosphokinase [Prevotella sp.]|nr:2-amino-4-hydroxy-6-hydroxymethyldihydropteridine diphosphokinase [Prevotella sp.]
MKHTVYLGLGTNLGDKEENIGEAVRRIGELIGTVECQSTLLVSEPWGFESENTFVNAALRCSTELEPMDVLEKTQEIERAMGRTQKSVDGQYHDRIIDIDILMYDDLHIDTKTLKLPHPLMKERDFVMIPLEEVLNH